MRARIFFIFYILGMVHHTNYFVWFFFPDNLYTGERKKIICKLKLHSKKCDGENQTQTANEASESAIHYTIASLANFVE